MTDALVNSPSQPFSCWQQARAALRLGEARGLEYPRLLRLSEAVIRSRLALTRERMVAGLDITADELDRLARDRALLRQRDDARQL